MRNHVLPLVCSFIALLIILPSVASVASARTINVGNDDNEYNISSGTPSSVSVSADFSSAMHWSSGNGISSLQNNPDEDYSCNINNCIALQSVVITTGVGCLTLSLQEYYSSTEVWYQNYPTTGCIGVHGDLVSGAFWEDTVYVSSGNERTSELWEVQGGGSQPGFLEQGISIPTKYQVHWIRANICWCGTDYETATYSSGSGTLTYTSNLKLNLVGEPVDIGTAENSNMNYGCFTGAGTTSMYQSYQPSTGHCTT